MKLNLFQDRVGVIATMHKKEQVISPIVREALGIYVIVPQFNTDVFGTFTREIKRPGDQIPTARLKAEKALEITKETIAIASEGSFNVHPMLPYTYFNREIVILIDKLNNLEIIGQELSLNTNFQHQRVANIEQALNFAQQIGFPEHGIIVRFDADDSNKEIFKGITTEEALIDAVNYVCKHSEDNQAHLETDMRAMYNPTRMKNIEKATKDLIKNINNACPECGYPALKMIEEKRGLPCSLCGFPTELIRAEVYQCRKCNFTVEVANDLDSADPSQCQYCNP